MKYEKPTDALARSIGRRIKIVLKDFTVISGILRSFDSHLTIRVDLVEEISPKPDSEIIKKNKILVRGNTILYIIFRSHDDPSTRKRLVRELISEGDALNNRGNKKDALQAYAKALDHAKAIKSRATPLVLNRIGDTYKDLDKLEEAIKHYDEAIAFSQDTPKSEVIALNKKGDVLLALDKRDKALKCYETSVELSKTEQYSKIHLISLTKLGKLLSLTNSLNRAEEVLSYSLETAIQANEPQFAARFSVGLGDVNMRIGNLKEALERYNYVIDRIKPPHGATERILAYQKSSSVLMRMSRWDEALKRAKASLELSRRRKERYHEVVSLAALGDISTKMGNHNESVIWYQEALKSADRNRHFRLAAFCTYRLAVIFGEFGEKQKAIQYFEKAMHRADRTRNERLKGRIETGLANLQQRNPTIALERYEKAEAIFRRTKDFKSLSITLNDKAELLLRIGKNQEAINTLEESIQIINSVGDPKGEQISLCKLSSVLMKVGKTKKAEKILERSLDITRETRDLQGQIVTLGLQGNLLEREGKLQDAIKSYEKAIELSKESKDIQKEKMNLDKLGNLYMRLGEYDPALESFQQSLIISKETDNRKMEIISLSQIGDLLIKKGNINNAIETYLKAHTIAIEVGAPEDQIIIANKIADLYTSMGKLNAALETYQESLSLGMKEGLKKAQIFSMEGISSVYFRLGRTDEAIEQTNKALELTRSIKDKQSESVVLSSLGFFYDSTSQYQRALELYRQCVELEEEVGNQRGKLAALHRHSDLLSRMGRYEEAIKSFEDSLSIARYINEPPAIIQSLNYLGDSYNRLKKHERALNFFEEALEIAITAGYRKSEITTLIKIGRTKAMLDKSMSNIVADFDKALHCARQIHEKNLEVSVLTNLGNALREIEEKEAAFEAYNTALDIARKAGNIRTILVTLNKLADAYATGEVIDKAIAIYQEALSLAETTDSEGLLARTQANYGTTLRKMGDDIEKAQQFLQKSLKHYQEKGNHKKTGEVLIQLGKTYPKKKERAVNAFEQALELFTEIDDQRGIASALVAIASSKIIDEQETAKELFTKALNINAISEKDKKVAKEELELLAGN